MIFDLYVAFLYISVIAGLLLSSVYVLAAVIWGGQYIAVPLSSTMALTSTALIGISLSSPGAATLPIFSVMATCWWIVLINSYVAVPTKGVSNGKSAG